MAVLLWDDLREGKWIRQRMANILRDIEARRLVVFAYHAAGVEEGGRDPPSRSSSAAEGTANPNEMTELIYRGLHSIGPLIPLNHAAQIDRAGLDLISLFDEEII